MSTGNTAVNVKIDTLKLSAAVAVVAAGVAGFYWFSGESLLFRVLGLLASIIVAILIGLQTEQGRGAWSFIQEAQNEVRMVVWPTRRETVHTTAIVIVMVIVFALLLWLLDWILGGLVKMLFGQ